MSKSVVAVSKLYHYFSTALVITMLKNRLHCLTKHLYIFVIWLTSLTHSIRLLKRMKDKQNISKWFCSTHYWYHSDAILRHRMWFVMACGIKIRVLSYIVNAQDIYLWYEFENYSSKFRVHFLGANELNICTVCTYVPHAKWDMTLKNCQYCLQ